MLVFNTEAPKGCVLSPLLFTLYIMTALPDSKRGTTTFVSFFVILILTTRGESISCQDVLREVHQSGMRKANQGDCCLFKHTPRG